VSYFLLVVGVLSKSFVSGHVELLSLSELICYIESW
jgi:hypothetical protein